MFVHGVADHIQAARDDRTVLIGCRDGRVMVFSVLLELTDHMQELVNLLPSRTLTPANQVPAQQSPVSNGVALSNVKTPVAEPRRKIGTHIAPVQTCEVTESNGLELTGTALKLSTDIKQIQNTHNMQKRLSTITRAMITKEKRKHSTFKSVGHAVLLTQELNKVRQSQACILQ